MLRVLHKNIPWRSMNGKPIQLSIWFDGSVYHPLVETLDRGEVVSGKLLHSSAHLVRAVRGSEDWIQNNCFDNRNIGAFT